MSDRRFALLLEVLELAEPQITGRSLGRNLGSGADNLARSGILTPVAPEAPLPDPRWHDSDDLAFESGWDAPLVGQAVEGAAADVSAYRISFARLLDMLSRALDLVAPRGPTELLADHVWDLGDLSISRSRKARSCSPGGCTLHPLSSSCVPCCSIARADQAGDDPYDHRLPSERRGVASRTPGSPAGQNLEPGRRDVWSRRTTSEEHLRGSRPRRLQHRPRLSRPRRPGSPHPRQRIPVQRRGADRHRPLAGQRLCPRPAAAHERGSRERWLAGRYAGEGLPRLSRLEEIENAHQAAAWFLLAGALKTATPPSAPPFHPIDLLRALPRSCPRRFNSPRGM